MASNTYTPPGVTVSEVVDPSISTVIATPATVCIVAPVTVSGSAASAGAITVTDAVTLSSTTAVALPSLVGKTVSATSIVQVVDATQPSVSEAQSNGVYPAGEGGYVYDSNALTIRRGNSSTVIPDGNTVYVTYTYTPTDYFQAIRLDNVADIERRFGAAYTDDGNSINSIITYAAGCAFENGAADVILQPLFFNNNGVRVQPNDAQVAAASTWVDNFVALRDIDAINVITPAIGQSYANVGDSQQLAIIEALQDHIKFMKDSEQQHIIAVVGEDSSTSGSVAQMATLRTHGATLAGRYGGDVAENTIFVSPSRFTRPTPSGNATALTVGGQYVAAAVAGMIASRPVSQSLTRKIIAGFATVAEARTKVDKNTDAANGLLVTEQKAGSVVIRHGVTLDTTSTVRREISIVRAKQRVMESVRSTCENLIGEVVADGDAAIVVQSAVIGVLEELRNAGDLIDYGDVQARTLSLDPTQIEVRFSYRPAFPVNYITVGFSLDLTTGDLTVADTANVDTSTF